MKLCLYCNKEIKSYRNIYCNIDCFQKYIKKQAFDNKKTCKMCPKKVKKNDNECCSFRCSVKYRLMKNPKEKFYCLLCEKEVSKFVKICKNCKSHNFHKIYTNYGISSIKEYIKTKNYCDKHLNFYDPEKYCKKCFSVKKIRNIRLCECGTAIPRNRTLCKKCLTEKFKYYYKK